MGMLVHLPVVPRLLPPPSRWGRLRRSLAADGFRRWMAGYWTRCEALLVKAESTNFEEEADALTAKAQELMARHAIDQAMVEAVTSSEEPVGRRVGVADPCAHSKANLLAVIADVNRCRSVWMAGYGFSTVFGFAGDVDIVEVFYLSLLVQATRAMTLLRRNGAADPAPERSSAQSFRRSFLLSFASRIGERLQTATRTAAAEAGDVHGGRLLPVLAGRAAAVDEAFDALFPDLLASSARISKTWPGGLPAVRGRRSGPPAVPSSKSLPASAADPETPSRALPFGSGVKAMPGMSRRASRAREMSTPSREGSCWTRLPVRRQRWRRRLLQCRCSGRLRRSELARKR